MWNFENTFSVTMITDKNVYKLAVHPFRESRFFNAVIDYADW